MFSINAHYLKLKAGYLFPEIGRRVTAFQQENPDAKIIRLGIGDVTEPLPDACRSAMHAAVEEQAEAVSFKGYGPEQGYAFLREAIVAGDYADLGIAVDEVFVSDGSKCDCGAVLDILGKDNAIAVTDPVYPVYVDTNVMAGNTQEAGDDGEYGGLVYLRATEDNGFMPEPPQEKVDVVYLCSPNNPTGAVMTREQMTRWVEWANANGALLLFDAAYRDFISGSSLPKSIYEIEGAHSCAIEFRSFSKNAGFTGIRCGFTIVPKALKGLAATGEEVALHGLWNRRQSTKFNGASFVVQRGAAAVYSTAGQAQVRALIAGYLDNAKRIREGLQQSGLTVFGGENAPYVWVKCPEGVGSWDLFDTLLQKAHVVTTPGAGFGRSGEGYIRISAFNSTSNVDEAIKRVLANMD